MGAGLAARHATSKRRSNALSPLTCSSNCCELFLLESRRTLQRHDNFAEMLVGFHALEGLADVGKCKHLVDRQLQCARFHRRPDVVANLVEDVADLLDRAGAEGDADIADPACRMQVEVEVGMAAAEPADIDNAAPDFGGREILAG